MAIPKPPDDHDLKNIIDKLANFVARNGPEFENMTKQKQKDNPKFSFLYGGENFHYYQYRVTTEQVIIRQQNQRAQQLQPQQQLQQPQQQQPPQQQQHVLQQQMQQLQHLDQQLQVQTQQVAEQVKQSELNLSAHHQQMQQQQQAQIEQTVLRARDDKLKRLAGESGLKLDDLDALVQPIVESCTKDAISNGKNWIFSHITEPMPSDCLAAYFLKRVTAAESSFQTRLHLIYLVNDIMHHCARKNVECLKKAIEKVIVAIFSCAYTSAADEDQRQKLAKVQTIWEQHRYFNPDVLEALKNPADAYSRYQADLITEHAELLAQITAGTNERYQQLQKQHQEFAAHLNLQLQQQQQQVAQQKQQILSQPPPLLPTPVSLLPLPGGPQQQGPPVIPPPFNPLQPPPNFSQPPPGLLPPPSNFQQPPPTSFQQPPPVLPFSVPPRLPPPPVTPQVFEYGPPMPSDIPPPVPDFSRPPPGFPPILAPAPTQPLMGSMAPSTNEQDLIPSLPYYDLPAGLMVPLVKLDDCEYAPLNAKDIRLPPPAPPSERLLAAVEAFYTPPSHERPVDADGWEKLGLYEYYRAKQVAKKKRAEEKEQQKKLEKRFKDRRSKSRSRSTSPGTARARGGGRNRSDSPLPYQPSSRSPSPVQQRASGQRRRPSSRSPSPLPYRRSSRSPGGQQSPLPYQRSSRSPSPLPYQRSSRSPSPQQQPPPPSRQGAPRRGEREPSRSPSPRRHGGGTRARSRSATPPSVAGLGSQPFYAAPDSRISDGNKGHMLLKKMGWGGAGLGATEQGIVDPISAGEVRDRTDMYKGIGIDLKDPFEQFRKSKANVFIQKLKDRDEPPYPKPKQQQQQQGSDGAPE